MAGTSQLVIERVGWLAAGEVRQIVKPGVRQDAPVERRQRFAVFGLGPRWRRGAVGSADPLAGPVGRLRNRGYDDQQLHRALPSGLSSVDGRVGSR